MSDIFYEIENDERFQDLVFNDDPEGVLGWEKTYYSLLRDRFGKRLPEDFSGFLISPNSENNRKRKKADAYLLGACSVMVLSERFVNSSLEFLEENGQFLELVGFPWGRYKAYHVTKISSDSVIWEKSSYREADYGRILYKATLKEAQVAGKDVFMIEEKISSIYVSEKFRLHFEVNGFTGLDFSIPILSE